MTRGRREEPGPWAFDLNLVVTYRCNLQCSHCIADCGPRRREALAVEDGERWIDAAAATGRLSVVGLTGGEPLLRLDAVRRLLAHASRRGAEGGIVTNCFWATSAAAARAKLAELRELGLRHLTVSCDGFHVPAVPLERVRRAVGAALELELGVTVNVVVTRDGPYSLLEVPDLLGVPRSELGRSVEIKEIAPLLIGRAAREIPRDALIRTDQPEWFDGPCRYVGRSPAVAPDGAVFACCCFGDSTRRAEARIGWAGNARERPLTDILEEMPRNLLFRLLEQNGPYALLRLVRARCPELRTRKRYFTTCDVCVELYRPAVRRRLASVLNELAVEARG